MENKINELASRCLNCKNPRCVEACPLHTNIPKMISKVKDENLQEAYEIIKETNPLGAICGLICPHENQCEGSCVRGIKETPVSIGKIENYVCQNALDNNLANKSQNESDENIQDKVAIIGGGPAGISLAYFLAKNKIHSTIFERENYLGRNFAVWYSRV